MNRPVILLTGADGQVGFELKDRLAAIGEVHATRRVDLDLADPGALRSAIRAIRPQIIVNAAAYTAVDRAESEQDLAFAVNARAPAIMAEEARASGAVLLHFSTDYVFDGTASEPYQEDAATAPLNVYGASKLEGEQAIAATGAHALVFRTSWVYGLRGANFLLTIRRLARERNELGIVHDQVGVPNWARTLAESVARIVGTGHAAMAERSGLYHLSCTGRASWYDFACAIVGENATTRVLPIGTAQYPRPARRPSFAVLDTSRFTRTFGFVLPAWRDDLQRCLQLLPD